MKCRTCLLGMLINNSRQLYSCTERGGLRVPGETYRNYRRRSLVLAKEKDDCEKYISRAYYEEVGKP